MPQTSNRESYARAVDIWSLGIIVHEILTSEIPFLQTDSDQMSESGFESELAPPEVDMTQLYEYCRGYREFPIESLQNSQVSKDGKDFVMGLLVANPRARLSAADALKSPWLLDRSQELSEELQASPYSTAMRTPATISDSEDDPGAESGSDHDNPRSPDLSVTSTHSIGGYYRDLTPAESFARLSSYIKSRGLQHFFRDDSIIAQCAEQAVKMHEGLKLSGCSWMMSNELTLLTLYDLVILVGT